MCVCVHVSVCVCVPVRVTESEVWAPLCVRRPAVLGSLSSFLILRILNQDHTSHLSDDKRSFGHSCQQAQQQSQENKGSSKSPF